MGAEREGERERERELTHHQVPLLVMNSLVIVALFVVHVRVARMCLWIDRVLS